MLSHLKSVTIKNGVLKSTDNYIKKIVSLYNDRGLFITCSTVFYSCVRWVRRFFCEYIPMKFHAFRADVNGLVRWSVQDHVMMLNVTDTGISRELLLFGVHEANSTKVVQEIIKPGMCVLEAGANVGYYACMQAKLVGPTGHIYAVEPSPSNVEMLQRNIKENGFTNMTVLQSAFGAEDGEQPFYVDKRSNLSSFVKRDDLGEYECIPMKIQTIDTYIADKKIDMIRMDVEGYEKEILLGAKETLSTRPPKYFFIEVHSELLAKRGSSTNEVCSYLRKYGYDVYKGFFRGRQDVMVESMEELLAHKNCEVGYWEVFFIHKD